MEQERKESNKGILILICLGIWALVLQNAGIIPQLDEGQDRSQSVYVTGGSIDADIKDPVEVSGSVKVDNTVSVSIDEVLDRDGKKYYFNNR